MKVKLLNDGGYGDMVNVKFPVVVSAQMCAGFVTVTKEELYRVGAEPEAFDVISRYAFLIGEHAEVVE